MKKWIVKHQLPESTLHEYRKYDDGLSIGKFQETFEEPIGSTAMKQLIRVS